jgi:hypothetical protein
MLLELTPIPNSSKSLTNYITDHGIHIMVDAWYSQHMKSFRISKGENGGHKAESETKILLLEYNVLIVSRCNSNHIPEHGANTPEETRFLLAWFVLVVQNCIQ